MIKVAICADNRDTAGMIDQILFEYARTNLLEIDIEVYFNKEELEEHLVSGSKFEMVFIDAELNQDKGIELARMLRTAWHDYTVIISIIIERAAIENNIFDAEPQRLILKPFTAADIIEAFKRMMEIYDRARSNYYTYKYGRDIYRVPIEDIVYFHVKDRIIHIKTVNDNKNDFFPGSLIMVEQEIGESSSNFFKTNKNHLVNLKHVTRISRKEIALSNGEVIALGENMYKLLINRTKVLRSVRGGKKMWR